MNFVKKKYEPLSYNEGEQRGRGGTGAGQIRRG